MKKLFFSILLCVLLLCSAVAAEPQYGYYDRDADGLVTVADTLSALRSLLQSEEGFSLLRAVQTASAAVTGTALNATVCTVDTAAKTVTFSTTAGDGIVASFAALGLDDTADATALDSLPAILTVQKPHSADATVFAARLSARLPANGANDRPLSIKMLNTRSEEGSHVEDDFLTASMESSFRDTVVLSAETMGHFRFDSMWYPRIKKLREDLYILFFMSGQVGPHLYWSLSKDCVTWDTPEVLYNANLHRFTHTDGPLVGTDHEQDALYGCNADALVLDNGDILCVYYIRPSHGYDENYAPYWDMNGIYLTRGTLNENDKVVWSAPKRIYTGPGWEPYIWQRADGVLEVYWSGTAPYMTRYGYDTTIRSAGVLMVQSFDGGETWVPDVQPGDQNYYMATRVMNAYLGTRVHPLQEELGALPYFGGQMPAVCRLVNGKTLLATEIRSLALQFTIETDVSDANGVWKSLGFSEASPNCDLADNFSGVSPYLVRFPSGEVLLNYSRGVKYRYRMMDAEGQTHEPTENAVFANDNGFWGSSTMLSGHEVINANQKKVTDASGTVTASNLVLNRSYLNHRINAQKFAVLVDGYTDDWANNTDALFVGSETQAQLAVQVAHDKDNVYFLLSRLDEELTDGDSVSLVLNGSITVAIGTDGGYTVGAYSGDGVSVRHAEGVLTELAIPKKVLGLQTADSFTLTPALINKDGDSLVTDKLAHADTPARHPRVVLQ